MCLAIKKQLVSKPVTVYKVYKFVKRVGDSIRVESLHQHVPYTLAVGKELVSNRPNKKITAREKKDRRVHYGLHVFTDYTDALANAIGEYENCVVVAFTAEHKNLVAKGIWQGSGQHNAVYHKLHVKKILARATYSDKSGKVRVYAYNG